MRRVESRLTKIHKIRNSEIRIRPKISPMKRKREWRENIWFMKPHRLHEPHVKQNTCERNMGCQDTWKEIQRKTYQTLNEGIGGVMIKKGIPWPQVK